MDESTLNYSVASSLILNAFFDVNFCSLEDLKQKINSGVNKVESEENEIPIGSLCVAKFSEDDL